jgi:translation elongation factor EF-Tu-like GTPase
VTLVATIEDIFTITGRGVVVVPALLSECRVRSGDPIQLRRSDGTVKNTSIFSVESLNLGSGKRRPAFMLAHNIAKEDIAEGDEIWIQEQREEGEK